MGKATNLFVCLFVVYISYSLYLFSTVLFPPQCPISSKTCLIPAFKSDDLVDIRVFVMTLAGDNVVGDPSKLIYSKSGVPIFETFKVEFNVTVSKLFHTNSTLYALVDIMLSHDQSTRHKKSVALTKKVVPSFKMDLLGNSSFTSSNKPSPHLREIFSVSLLGECFRFNKLQMPPHILQNLHTVYSGTKYLPVWHLDNLSLREKDLKYISPEASEMSVEFQYNPISMGQYNIFLSMESSFTSMKEMGFSSADFDEMKSLLVDSNPIILLLTICVSFFHLLFDFLAFKNDISYWIHKRDMIGLSYTALVWRFFSHFIIFLYLYDQRTSLLILIPMGIGTIIELWKVSKAFRVTVQWQGVFPRFSFGKEQENERSTNEYDGVALNYLMIAMVPLCIGGAVYSLVYVPHKSIYSWIIQSLVNGVYAFGFLFMMPQLFVNYKLKSVAHLPWKAFMYKAFNTFIDDIFAFIITMPTAHRFACFRDDVIFVVYLYQRWLYPVDKTRANEYGQNFDEKPKKD